MVRSEATGDTHPNDDVLIALNDGVLFPGDKPVVEAHLKTCTRCQTRLAVLTGQAPTRQREDPPAGRARRTVGARVALAAIVIGAIAGGAIFLQREITRRNNEPVTLASTPETPPSRPPTLDGFPTPPAEAAPETVPDAATPDAPAAPSDTTTPPSPAPIQIVSPNRNFRWRIVGLEVERTTDGGAMWRKQMVTLSKPMTGGTAPSASVCWLVGREGAVFVAVGADWKQVSLTEPVNLVSVAAIDSMNATVTAADGRTFSTGDAGVTWIPVP